MGVLATERPTKPQGTPFVLERLIFNTPRIRVGGLAQVIDRATNLAGQRSPSAAWFSSPHPAPP